MHAGRTRPIIVGCGCLSPLLVYFFFRQARSTTTTCRRRDRPVVAVGSIVRCVARVRCTVQHARHNTHAKRYEPFAHAEAVHGTVYIRAEAHTLIARVCRVSYSYWATWPDSRHEEEGRRSRPGPSPEHDAGGHRAARAEQVSDRWQPTVGSQRQAAADAHAGRTPHARALAVRHGRVSGHVPVRGRRLRRGHLGRVARPWRGCCVRVHHAGPYRVSAERFR